MDELVTHYILSYGGAAGLCLLLILTGVLVTRREHKDALASQARELEAERDKSAKLGEANGRLQAALDIERATNERLTSSGQLTNQLVGALITIAAENRQAAAGPAVPPPPALTAGGQ